METIKELEERLEQMKAEEQKNREARLKAILDGNCVFDEKGRVVKISGCTTNIYNLEVMLKNLSKKGYEVLVVDYKEEHTIRDAKVTFSFEYAEEI